MKNRNLLLSITLSILLIVSCSKEETELQIKPKPKLYIRGNFGNDNIEFINYTENLNNYYEYPNDPLSNCLSFIMHEKSEFYETRYVQIAVSRIDIDKITTPWESSPTVYYPGPYVEFSLVDLGKTDVQFDANDSINYVGAQLLGDFVYVKIDAIIGDTIEGIFHGDIKTKTGLVKSVTNGEFRVKIQRTQID